MRSTLIKYLLLSTTLIFTSKILEKYLHLDKLIYNSLSENLTNQQVEIFLEIKEKSKCINYAIIPFFLLLKIAIITSIIYIGSFFMNKELKYKPLINIVLNAEFIFLLVPIFKIIWFYFFQTNYNLNDIQNFYPLSALNIVGYKGLETWFIYPFQVLNLFEVFYIIYLGFEIGKLTHTNTDYGLKIVGISYIPALVLWVATVMFFTLNYS